MIFKTLIKTPFLLVPKKIPRRCACAFHCCGSQYLGSSSKHIPRASLPWQSFTRGARKQPFGSKKSLAPVEQVEVQSLGGLKALVKPFGFTLLVGSCSFAGCAVWQYETIRKFVDRMQSGSQEQAAGDFYRKAGTYRLKANAWWNSLSPGSKLTASIIAVNAVVLLMWRASPLTGFMIKYFTSSPVSGAPCRSMFLSMFSQHGLIHFAANMYVLWSFTPTVTAMLGREQFLAMYLTAGMVSGFASYAYKIARRSAIPSLGASGAIMAVIGIVCSQNPDARLAIAFIGDIIPHSFSADSAMKFLIAFDTLGVIFGWKFFDHAAHLGGMLFGLWYAKYGHDVIWKNREGFIKRWHKIRGSSNK